MRNFYLLITIFSFLPILALTQNTYVPDDNFEQALIGLGYDTELDDSVPTATLQEITELSIGYKEIEDLTGIEECIALQYLYCWGNGLTSLALSKNVELLTVSCEGNQLSSLDLSSNPKLQTLNCHGNGISGLVLNNPELGELVCDENNLATLDLSSCTSLKTLDCSENQLTGLDLSNNSSLKYLNCTNNQLTSLNLKNGNNSNMDNMYATSNHELYCIEVDDAQAAANYSDWEKDGIASYSEDCSNFVPNIAMTYVPDDNFEQALIDLSYDTELDDSVPTATLQTITEMDISWREIEDLTGIEECIALEYLYCNGNGFTSMDLSNSTELAYLNCSENQLTGLDLSNNNSLKYLNCNNNNQLSGLNLKNGNNSNMADGEWWDEIGMYATSNPYLYCIEVDDAEAAANYSNWEKDGIASYSEDCSNFVPNIAMTYVPDDNFEQALIDLSYDTEMDDSVPTATLQTITELDIPWRDIEDLTGIEECIALEYLYCNGNGFTSMDLSSSTELAYLNCSDNQLTGLDLSNNNSLKYLNCNNNQLSGLNLRNGNNSDMDDAGEDWWDEIGMYATSNPYLYCIEVDDAEAAANYSNWEKDGIATYNEDCSNFVPNIAMTYVPDDNFEQALIDLSYDTELDDSVPTATLQTITEMDISWREIEDLTGIEECIALEYLYCNGNEFTSLDLSSNTALTELYCYNSGLSELSVSNNTALSYLYCPENQLTYLDLSANTALTYLNCTNNKLSGLNLKNGNNSNMADGEWWDEIGMYATSNPYLYCIEVDDAQAAANYSNWEKDGIATYNEDCSNFVPQKFEMTYVPDDNFEEALIDLGYDTELDDSVPKATLQSIIYLEVSRLEIEDLTGIGECTALEYLYCYGNELTSLDLSNNTALIELNCEDNQLSSLDLANNTDLWYLHCGSNQLTSLDVSNNTGLEELYCGKNQLTSLDLRNGNNDNLYNIDATRNPYLYCIEVDDAQAAANYSNWEKDGIATYNEDCSNFVPQKFEMTYVPDDNFEEAFIDLGYDTELDDSVPTATLQSITELEISGLEIEDLTGIEECIALEHLYCDGNGLTSLDLSNNTALIELNCEDNQLSSLDLANNTDLWYLHCGGNQLTSLDVSNNTGLEELYCGNNQLSGLDLSANTSLWKLHCSGNKLTSLDLSNNDNLEYLDCTNNLLTSLNIKNGNNNYMDMYATDNPNLYCIEVDDAQAAANYPDWGKDDIASYSENCSNENHAPVADAGETQTVEEGSSVKLDGTGSYDADGDSLMFQWTAPVGITLDNETSPTPSFVAPAINDSTILVFALTVNDSLAESSPDTTIVIVTPVNEAPVIVSTPITEATEDIIYVDTVFAEDADGDPLSYQLTEAPKGMEIDGNMITWTPAEGTLSGDVVLTVSDGELSDTLAYTVTVTPVNDKPVITSTAPTIATENEQYVYTVEAEDAEDSTLTYKLETYPSGMEIDGNVITWTPATGTTTSGDVTLTVSDGELSNTEIFSVTVSTQHAPAITSTAPTTATEDEQYIYEITANDVDGDTLTYSMETYPTGMEIDSNIITWTPAEGILSGDVVLVVSDGGLADTSRFSITVTPVNDAPVITSTAPTTATEDELYTYEVTAVDVDSDSLTYRLEAIPSGMEIDGNIITWTPTEGVLSGDVVLVASDGELSDKSGFSIKVAPVNDAPEITSDAPTTAEKDVEYIYEVTAEDVDSDNLTYTLEASPSGMEINGNIISWTPSDGGISTDVVLLVSDGELSDSSSFTITVEEEKSTFTVIFVVTDGTAPIAGASVSLSGYGTQLTNSNGEAAFNNIYPDSSLAYSVSANGYDLSLGYTSVINEDVGILVNITPIEQEKYDVTFVLNDGGSVVEGAIVSLGKYGSSTSNASGSVTFNDVDPTDNIAYSVFADNYSLLTGSANIESDTVLSLNLESTVHAVRFEILDGNGAAEGAYVMLGSYGTVITGNDGMAVFENVSAENNIEYCVYSAGYEIEIGTISVTDSDITKTIGLASSNKLAYASSYNVNFTVLNGSDPVENATIFFGRYGIAYTDSQGSATFNDVSPSDGINYCANIDGYGLVTGSAKVASSDENIVINIYEETFSTEFYVRKDDVPFAGATVTIQGFGQKETAGDGKVAFTEIKDRSDLSYCVSVVGYDLECGNIVIDGEDVSKTFDFYTDKGSKVSFIVMYGGDKIEGASISLSGYGTQATNVSGIAVFDSVSSASGIGYSVLSDNYKMFSGTVNVNGTNVEKEVDLSASTYKATFIVTSGSQLLEGATVSVNGFGSRETNKNGAATFLNIPSATGLDYQVTAPAHTGTEGETTLIASNLSKNIALEFVGVKVKFTVVDGQGGPIENAEIIFNGETLYSGINGQIVFSGVNIADSMSYNVTIDGYYTQDGTVDVTENGASETITLVATGMGNWDNPQIEVYPNPAKNTVFVKNASGRPIAIYNLQGKIIKQFVSTSDVEEINVSSFRAGIYFIRVGDGVTKLVVKPGK